MSEIIVYSPSGKTILKKRSSRSIQSEVNSLMIALNNGEYYPEKRTSPSGYVIQLKHMTLTESKPGGRIAVEDDVQRIHITKKQLTEYLVLAAQGKISQWLKDKLLEAEANKGVNHD